MTICVNFDANGRKLIVIIAPRLFQFASIDSRTIFRQRTILRQDYITTSDPSRNIVRWMDFISTADYIATRIRSRILTLHLFPIDTYLISIFNIFIHIFVVDIFYMFFYRAVQELKIQRCS